MNTSPVDELSDHFEFVLCAAVYEHWRLFLSYPDYVNSQKLNSAIHSAAIALIMTTGGDSEHVLDTVEFLRAIVRQLNNEVNDVAIHATA